MNEREDKLEDALTTLLNVVEVFPPESADARAVYEQASREARQALRDRKRTKPRAVAVA